MLSVDVATQLGSSNTCKIHNFTPNQTKLLEKAIDQVPTYRTRTGKNTSKGLCGSTKLTNITNNYSFFPYIYI